MEESPVPELTYLQKRLQANERKDATKLHQEKHHQQPVLDLAAQEYVLEGDDPPIDGIGHPERRPLNQLRVEGEELWLGQQLLVGTEPDDFAHNAIGYEVDQEHQAGHAHHLQYGQIEHGSDGQEAKQEPEGTECDIAPVDQIQDESGHLDGGHCLVQLGECIALDSSPCLAAAIHVFSILPVVLIVLILLIIQIIHILYVLHVALSRNA